MEKVRDGAGNDCIASARENGDRKRKLASNLLIYLYIILYPAHGDDKMKKGFGLKKERVFVCERAQRISTARHTLL